MDYLGVSETNAGIPQSMAIFDVINHQMFGYLMFRQSDLKMLKIRPNSLSKQDEYPNRPGFLWKLCWLLANTHANTKQAQAQTLLTISQCIGG